MNEATEQQPGRSPVTWRAVALGLLLIPVDIWWQVQIEYIRYSDSPTIPALYFNAIGVLLALIALNSLARRLRVFRPLTRAELLTVYIIIVTASNIAGHDWMQILFTTIVYVVQHADSANQWDTLILPHLPHWLIITDYDTLRALHLGGANVWDGHWRLWVRPVAWWTSFLFSLSWTMLCLAALVRKQWENERLNYPIAEIPLQMTAGKELWRQPSFWWAFGIAATLQVMNFIHTMVPAFPAPNLNVRYYRATSMPWAAAGNIPISFFPFAIGLAYMLPVQLLFSCWVFFFLGRLEMVIAAAMGHRVWQGFPYIKQQSLGAYFMLCLMTLWVSRHYWVGVWRAAWGRSGEDRGEPVDYRLAMLGAVAGITFGIGFLIAAGMRWWVAFAFYIPWLMTVFAIARIRAELGIPSIEQYQAGADDILRLALGTRRFPPGDLTVMTMCFFMVRTHRQFPMTNHVDAFRMAHRSDMPQRRVAAVLAVATAVSIITAFAVLMHGVYWEGLATGHFTGPAPRAFGNEPWRKLGSWLKLPEDGEFGYVGGMMFGAAVTYLLTLLRLRFVWWPLHPLGYVVSGSFALMRLWVPLFISWLVKSLLLRYKGLSGYRMAVPFMLGLIMGEFSVGFLRTIIDLIYDLRLPVSTGIGGL